MRDNKRLFPYKKAIVLNVLYDALDALSFVIDKSNSVRGTLLVSSKTFPEMKGQIAISPTLSGEQAVIEIFTNDTEQSEWVDALLDEMRSLIERSGMEATI